MSVLQQQGSDLFKGFAHLPSVQQPAVLVGNHFNLMALAFQGTAG